MVSGNRGRIKFFAKISLSRTDILELKVLLTTLALYPPAINDQKALLARKPGSLKCKLPSLAVETNF
jgi:hypothetical protein